VKHSAAFERLRGRAILGVAAATLVLSALLVASAQTPPPTNPQAKTPAVPGNPAEREAWRKAMLKVPHPKKGCFTATYPDKAWREIPCRPSKPHKLFLPHAGGISRLDTVGGSGPDFSPTVTGHISTAEGSFDSATGITSTGVYSLQLNTAPFLTSTCSGSPNNTGLLTTGCRGWEQFVYESSGAAYIQYWILDYGPAGTMCPTPRHSGCAAGSSYSDGWCPVSIVLEPGDANPTQCVINGVNEPPSPGEPMSSLGQLKLAGAAGDSITVSVGGTPYPATGDNRFPDLGSVWNEAEFNVFGDGNSSQATFNSGASLLVRTEVISGSSAGPGCDLRTFTGESSNLTLVNTPPTSPSPTPAPALVFAETNPAPAGGSASCLDAVSLGDTHLRTFGGLLYDFQATGDFLLADTGRDFIVQTRQVSGAPTWPNAAVNKAVAVKSGKDRVALCLPERLTINGRQAAVADGGRVRLPGGGGVERHANAYTVFSANGDSVRAEMDGSYINVSVGLGRWPSKARGLLANVENNANEIAARDGAVLRSPFSFETLYGHFTDSWRVAANESLLAACGAPREVSREVPKKPFFASDIEPQLAKRNREICARAGVKDGPYLNACIIDVAMLGPQAAAALAGRAAPVVVGDAAYRK